MSFEAMSWAVKQQTGSASGKLILLMLANHTNGHTGQCNPSHPTLAAECEMGLSCLKEHIKKLEKLGFLKTIRKMQDGVNLPNQYVLNIGGVGHQTTQGWSPNDPGVGRQTSTNQEVVNLEVNQEVNKGFDQFWDMYPAGKGNKAETAAVWVQMYKESQSGEVDQILAGLKRWVVSDNWTKESGRYIPNPTRFLREERWKSPQARRHYEDNADAAMAEARFSGMTVREIEKILEAESKNR